jgi:hypothetical protein
MMMIRQEHRLGRLRSSHKQQKAAIPFSFFDSRIIPLVKYNESKYNLINKMDFELSTQAKHWMFDEASLVECRQRAAVVQSTGNSKPRVLKFASGFGQQSNNRLDSIETSPLQQTDAHTEPNLSSNDQASLVHFHAHQLQRLIGPNAIFPGLQRSASSLSTAIMIFRRFYLSNSVIDFHPRNIAAASALLAVKVDCENKLEVSFNKKLIDVLFICVSFYTVYVVVC